ncbi:MAG: acetoacetate--CoA ligase [Clostridia bacterium]
MQTLLYTPSEKVIKSTKMYDFMRYVNQKLSLPATINGVAMVELTDYKTLYKWSVENIEQFWDMLWKYLDIISTPYSKVVDDLHKFPGANWFIGAKLNYAENILRFSHSSSPAIIFRGENKIRSEMSHKQLHEEVIRLAMSLKELGVGKGDTVSAYMPNIPQTIIAMLATTSLGAIWCSCATDIGTLAAIDRLGQVNPKVLFTADGYYYKGVSFDCLSKANIIAQGIPTLKKVIVAHYAGDNDISKVANAISYQDFLSNGDISTFKYEQVEANTPMVTMFSSGTTGKPKCMVQSVAGLLINQLKELVLHHDVKPTDRMLYITTCSWMMWNWQAAALGAGSSIVLYDGNPSYPDTSAIWKILEEEQVSIFGLSASYIHSLLAEGFVPKDVCDLSHLRCISQTGSALSDEGFKYVYRAIKSDLHFNSIAGGTDINGCFASGNPISPVYSNELQAPGLGMKIECFDEQGKPIRDTQGELVCLAPTPSMPIYFYNDTNNERYLTAYFKVYPNIWYHGDYVTFNSQTGGITFYGRSDSVLKPSGVRIGTAEIYNQVEKITSVKDSLAIGQNYHDDQRVLLFVQLKEGYVLDDALIKEIKTTLRKNASPRHVPALIIAVPDIPKTLNGKKVESAVTNIVNCRKVTNRDALANPESLDFFTQILPELQK